jgi:diguanylate cyclase (GGDEF)-like protein
MQASETAQGVPDNPFEPIIQRVLSHASISDSLSDQAIKELSIMVNSLPALRRRATDSDPLSHDHVFLIDGYGEVGFNLAQALAQMSIGVGIVPNLTAALELNEELRIAKILIVGEAVLAPDHAEQMKDLLDRFTESGLERPSVVLASTGKLSFDQRLVATEFGTVRIFKSEDEPRSVRDFVHSVTADGELSGSRVLLIDDSPTDAYRATKYMRQAGLLVEHVQDPSKALEAIRRFGPNLIVLDYHMPIANGDRMASLIRQDPEMTMPIIFLSSMSDSELQLDAIAQGGDGFLLKPLQEGAFLRAIKSIMSRARSIDRRMRRDPLTCLLNHAQILESAKRLVADGCSGSLAIIDIDHFKTINDTYGHPVGDRVLIAMAEFLTAALRDSDFVGRIGGEEFAVVLPGTPPDVAYTVMERIRQSFANVQHDAGDGSFACSFSCGITNLSSSLAVSMKQADEALYSAKHGGRNRTVVSEDANFNDGAKLSQNGSPEFQ